MSSALNFEKCYKIMPVAEKNNKLITERLGGNYIVVLEDFYEVRKGLYCCTFKSVDGFSQEKYEGIMVAMQLESLSDEEKKCCIRIVETMFDSSSEKYLMEKAFTNIQRKTYEESERTIQRLKAGIAEDKASLVCKYLDSSKEKGLDEKIINVLVANKLQEITEGKSDMEKELIDGCKAWINKN